MAVYHVKIKASQTGPMSFSTLKAATRFWNLHEISEGDFIQRFAHEATEPEIVMVVTPKGTGFDPASMGRIYITPRLTEYIMQDAADVIS